MILYLVHPEDNDGVWLADHLRRQWADQLVVLSPLELLCAQELTHRLGRGGTHSEVVLQSGITLMSDRIRAVFNRIQYLPDATMAAAQGADRSYAMSEVQALLTSWLCSLPCPVWNPPSPIHLAGDPLSPLTWAKYALDCGIDVLPREYNGEQAEDERPKSVTMILGLYCAGRLLLPLNDWQAYLAPKVDQLASRAHLPLMSVKFAVHQGTPLFVSGHPFVPFQQFGEAGVKLIQEQLEVECLTCS